MATPVITNPYNENNLLTLYLDEEFSVRIAVSNTPTRLDITGTWIGWSGRWIAADDEIELYITPTRLITDLVGVGIVATNSDGNDIESIPYQIINRLPIIADIADRTFSKGQTGVDYEIEVQNNPSAISVKGDLIGLSHEPGSIGVRIFGDIVDGELTKPSGTYTVDASNGSGAAEQKTGRWGIPAIPYKATGLRATIGNEMLTINWDEILAFPNLNRVQIRRATSQSALNSASWTTLDDDATSHTYTNLNNGTTYYIQVRSRNSIGNSPVSDAFSATPQAAPMLPTAPTDLRIIPGDREIEFLWTRPNTYPALTSQQYRISLTQSGLSSASWQTLSATANSHTVTNLLNGTIYYVQVRAINSLGPGPPSSIASARPQSTPMAPTNVSVISGHESLTVLWTPPLQVYPSLDSQEYRIATSQSGLSSAQWVQIGSTQQSLLISNLDNGTTYYIQLRAINSLGAGPASSAQSGTPQPIPSVPSIVTNLNIVTGDRNAEVTWELPNAFPALSNVQLRHATTQGGLSGSWTNLGASATSRTITGLTNGNNVFVQVRAVNSEGNGQSSIASARVEPDLVVTVETGEQQATFTITAINGATSYAYRIGSSGSWTSVGNVSSYVLTGLTENSYTVYWRVNTPWQGTETEVGVSFTIRVAIVDVGNNDIGIFDISGDSGTEAILEKRFNLPSGWTFPAGITYLGNNRVLVSDAQIDKIGIFDITASDGSTLSPESEFDLSSNWQNPGGVTNLGNDRIAIADSSQARFALFDISVQPGQTLEPTVDSSGDPIIFSLSFDWYFPQGIAYLGNNIIAICGVVNEEIGTFDVSGTSTNPATQLNHYAYASSPSWGEADGLEYLGNNKIALLDSGQQEKIGIFELPSGPAGATDGAVLILESYVTLPSGWGTPKGIALLD